MTAVTPANVDKVRPMFGAVIDVCQEFGWAHGSLSAWIRDELARRQQDAVAFDLEAAKRGDRVQWQDSPGSWHYVKFVGPWSADSSVVDLGNGPEVWAHGRLRMAPRRTREGINIAMELDKHGRLTDATIEKAMTDIKACFDKRLDHIETALRRIRMSHGDAMDIDYALNVRVS